MSAGNAAPGLYKFVDSGMVVTYSDSASGSSGARTAQGSLAFGSVKTKHRPPLVVGATPVPTPTPAPTASPTPALAPTNAVNVRDFGAVGNGITDDTASISRLPVISADELERLERLDSRKAPKREVERAAVLLRYAAGEGPGAIQHALGLRADLPFTNASTRRWQPGWKRD